MKTSAKSTFFLFTAAIVWGFAFVAQKFGGTHITPFYFNGLRFIIGAVTLIPVVLLFEKEKKDTAKLKRTIRAGALCAAVLFIASALQQFGINAVGAGKGAFITALYTVLVPIFYFLFFRRKTAVSVWIGAVLAVVGVFLLSINEDFTLGVGDLVLFIGAIFWAFHIMAIDRNVVGVSPVKFAMFQAFFAGFYNLAVAILSKPVLTALSGAFPKANLTQYIESVSLSGISDAIIPLLYCGMCSTAIAYTCQILGQKGSDPTFATIVLSTESIFGVLGGVLLGDESMSARGIVGCILAFGGIIVSQLDWKQLFSKKKDAVGTKK